MSFQQSLLGVMGTAMKMKVGKAVVAGQNATAGNSGGVHLPSTNDLLGKFANPNEYAKSIGMASMNASQGVKQNKQAAVGAFLQPTPQKKVEPAKEASNDKK